MAKKVLICDDELYILEAVQYVVRRAGYVPLLAQNGEEALTLAQEEHPDMIILDIMLPKMDGYKVCSLLKSKPNTKDIYIMILTARGYESDNEKSIQNGADEFLTKPFSPHKLQQRLNRILNDDQQAHNVLSLEK
jgi:DNA-binding response OmpR family regulator